MTGYTVHTGSTDKFSQGWDGIFGSKKPAAKAAAKKAPAKKPAAKKAPAKKTAKAKKS